MKETTIEQLANLICGDDKDFAPIYRNSKNLTRFFASVGLGRFVHDGTTRKWWVVNCLRQCSESELEKAILGIASPNIYRGDTESFKLVLKSLNTILAPEGIKIETNGSISFMTKLEPPPSSPVSNAILFANEPNFSSFQMPPEFIQILRNRWKEIGICVQYDAYLAALILMGSLLEAILYWSLTKYPEKANRTACSPKDPKTGKSKPISDWTLSQMIDVAHELNWLDGDVKKYSHTLREFRNLVHPFQQIKDAIVPDKDTCAISWQVVLASVNDWPSNFLVPSCVTSNLPNIETSPLE